MVVFFFGDIIQNGTDKVCTSHT